MLRFYLPSLFLLFAVAHVQALQVGVGVVDLSPSLYEIKTRGIWLGGYGFLGFRDGFPRSPAEGVHDPVWARSMAIEDDDGNGFVFSVIDTVGIGNRLLGEIRKAVAEKTGLEETRVFVGATHTHSGPDLQGLWGYVSDSYRQFVLEGTVESLVSAWESRQSASLQLSNGVGSSRNRRGWGYTDDEMTVMDAVAADGSRIGTVIQFTAHPVSVSSSVLEVSSDWVHYARAFAEEELGAPVIYVNGAIGDASPSWADGAVMVDDSAEDDSDNPLTPILADVTRSFVSFLRERLDNNPNQKYALEALKEIVENMLPGRKGDNGEEDFGLEEFRTMVAAFGFSLPEDIDSLNTERVKDGDDDDRFRKAMDYGSKVAERAIEIMSHGHVEVSGSASVEVRTSVYLQRVSNILFRLAFMIDILDYDVIRDDTGDFVETSVSYLRLSTEEDGPVLEENFSAPFKFFAGLHSDTLGYFVPEDEWWTGRNGNYEEMVSVDKYACENALVELSELVAEATMQPALAQ